MPINPIPLSGTNTTADNLRGSMRKTTEITFFPRDPLYQFSDIILDSKLKDTIMDALSIFKFRDQIFDKWNLSAVIKKPLNICINLYGQSGTGKTMTANAIAHELKLKIIKVNYAEIESKYVGETAKNLVMLFSKAEEQKALILFDEADALLSRRVTDMNNASDVSVNQTRAVLLTLLDTFEGIIIFTTNFISNYDSAFMRRIPYHIYFEMPNEEVRVELLKHYLINTIPNDINIREIAKKYSGITGSDISNATLMGALKTAREEKALLLQSDFEEILNQIISSKKANYGKNIQYESRDITEEYALAQIKKREGTEL